MRIVNCFCHSLITSVLTALLLSADLAGAEKIRIALPSRSLGYPPMFVAMHRGYLKDENLDLELTAMLPNIAHNALLGGEVEYHGVADSALRLAAKGAPLKTIFFGARLPPLKTKEEVPPEKIMSLKLMREVAEELPGKR